MRANAHKKSYIIKFIRNIKYQLQRKAFFGKAPENRWYCFMKNSKILAVLMVLVLSLSLIFVASLSLSAAEEAPASTEAAPAPETKTEEKADNSTGLKAIAAAAVVAVVATTGAIGMAIAIAKSTDGMARQPEAASKINSAMMLGLVFIETAIIYALIVAILIIFVL